MYLRFQTKLSDTSSGRPTGILVAAHRLRDGNDISMDDESWLRDHLAHYNMHLKVPSCLKEPEHRRALSWFRPGSSMIDHVWDLVAFMEEHDIFIDILKTRDPGIVLYEDGHQVVAKPYKKKSRRM